MSPDPKTRRTLNTHDMKHLETDASGELFWNGKKVRRGLSRVEIATIAVPIVTLLGAIASALIIVSFG